MNQEKKDDLRQYFASMLMQLADDIKDNPGLFTSGYFVSKLDALRAEYMKAFNVEPEFGHRVTERSKKSYYGILPKEEGVKLRKQTRTMRKEWDDH
jgi:hypothetical protein